MKSINTSVLVWALMAVLLNACSSVPFMPSPEGEQTTETQVTETQPTEAEPVEQLSPMQVKVLALKAKPNLYQTEYAEQNVTLSPTVKKQFSQALAFKQNGQIDKATEIFTRLSESQPQLSGVWVQLAQLATHAENSANLSKAVIYLNKAISANSLNYLAYNQLGQALRKQGQFSQALEQYQQALKIWPAFPEAYLNRGVLYDLYLGEKTLALEDYTLYQALLDEPSRQIKGWIIDLQRQIKANDRKMQNGENR